MTLRHLLLSGHYLYQQVIAASAVVTYQLSQDTISNNIESPPMASRQEACIYLCCKVKCVLAHVKSSPPMPHALSACRPNYRCERATSQPWSRCLIQGSSWLFNPMHVMLRYWQPGKCLGSPEHSSHNGRQAPIVLWSTSVPHMMCMCNFDMGRPCALEKERQRVAHLQGDNPAPAGIAAISYPAGLVQVCSHQGVPEGIEECQPHGLAAGPHQVIQAGHSCHHNHHVESYPEMSWGSNCRASVAV